MDAAIARVNPISFAALLGRGPVLGTGTGWSYPGYLAAFALVMLTIGFAVSARWLKVE